ncbi:hypothetical protein CDAR_414321 [Caerostris darwini]|uniref:Uncharacterized protein n=1 Tax=Caerostris darwini TaxID=1538125 RepID=A0AAV4REE5_9ARAC|nr:hypothetical protein CDAR_414321 [Caerostris darwini]
MRSDQKAVCAPTHQPEDSSGRHLEASPKSSLVRRIAGGENGALRMSRRFTPAPVFSKSPGLIKFVLSPRLDVGDSLIPLNETML